MFLGEPHKAFTIMAWLKLTDKSLYLMEGNQYLKKQDLREHQEGRALDIPFDWFKGDTLPMVVSITNGAEVVEPAPHPAPPPARFVGKDLASRILQYMDGKGYKIFEGPQEYNIVYVEGMDTDGSLNSDAFNVFNDIRLVVEVVHGQPKIVGGPWIATTEPSRIYTHQPMNPKGAARIAFDQYAAWQVGDHKGHEALVQTGGKVTVCRDLDKNGFRTGDKLDSDFHGINQHHGYNNPKENIGRASAGCLVGRSIKEHEQFMSIIKQDRRYQKNRNFVFTTTVIPGDDFVKQVPA